MRKIECFECRSKEMNKIQITNFIISISTNLNYNKYFLYLAFMSKKTSKSVKRLPLKEKPTKINMPVDDF
jgi:hypothetical protein